MPAKCRNLDKNHTETIYAHGIQTITSQERWLKGQGPISSGHREEEEKKTDSAHYKRALIYCFLSLSKDLIANIHCNKGMIRVQWKWKDGTMQVSKVLFYLRRQLVKL